MCDVVELGDVLLISAKLCRKSAHIPALTDNDDCWINLLKFCTYFVDCLDIHQTHKIESETIEVVFTGPELH